MKTIKNLITLTVLASLWLFATSSALAQQPCVAGFVYTMGTPTPNGASVAFYDSSWTAGTITNWSWSFGNGTGSTQQNPTASLNPGNNYVCLTIVAVYQNQTCTSTYCDSIFVPNPNGCSANFYYGYNAFGIQFAAAGSNITSYLWDFGDGTTSTAMTPTHAYANIGNYNVCLTVTDISGVTCTFCQNVASSNTTGCQAYFTSVQTSGSSFDFTNQSTGNATYFAWDFGDGNFSNTQNPTHNYSSGGYYSVCLTIIDSIAGCLDTYCDSIFAQGSLPCNATFGFQTSPALGTTFTASANSGNTSWTWDFGDGSTGTGANVTHAYAPGTYVACLTVTNANGLSCTSCQTIVIQQTSGCSSNFAIYPDSTVQHSYFAYNLASGVGPLSYIWSWGDGTSSNTAYPSHTYASAGTYTICLTITDATGCSSNTCYTFSLLRVGSSSAPVTINVIAGSTGINENDFLNSLVISPNPASEMVQANFNLLQATNVEYSIRNITGQVMMVAPALMFEAGSHEVKVDVSEFASGLYLMEITAGGKKSYSKILVQ
jgi:PKD repeat protein